MERQRLTEKQIVGCSSLNPSLHSCLPCSLLSLVTFPVYFLFLSENVGQSTVSGSFHAFVARFACPFCLFPPRELRLTMHNRTSGSARACCQHVKQTAPTCSVMSSVFKKPSNFCQNLHAGCTVWDGKFQKRPHRSRSQATKNIPDLHLMISLNSSLAPPSAKSPCNAIVDY